MMSTFDYRYAHQRVLILFYPCGMVEAYADSNVDVHFARIPVAHSIEAEIVAENVCELSLPLRYRPLFRRDRLRAVGTTRPLLPSVLEQSFAVPDCLKRLNQLTGANLENEVVVWT